MVFLADFDVHRGAFKYESSRLRTIRCLGNVNTHEINDYKWIQMTLWQGKTALYTPADPSIMRLSNPGIESRNSQWEGANLADCHSQKSLLVIVWVIHKHWWQIKRERLICGPFAMKYGHVLEEIPGAACFSVSMSHCVLPLVWKFSFSHQFW